jgi:hypothetical protein
MFLQLKVTPTKQRTDYLDILCLLFRGKTLVMQSLSRASATVIAESSMEEVACSDIAFGFSHTLGQVKKKNWLRTTLDKGQYPA